jgi:hypothetical protein
MKLAVLSLFVLSFCIVITAAGSDLKKCAPTAIEAAQLFQNHIVRDILVHTPFTKIQEQIEVKDEQNLTWIQYLIYTSNAKSTRELGSVVVSSPECQIQSVRRYLPLIPTL